MQSPSIHVSISGQTLTLLGPRGSSAARVPGLHLAIWPGDGARQLQDPAGAVRDCPEKSAPAQPLGAVFKGRAPTGEIGDASNPGDLVQTRILWLQRAGSRRMRTRSSVTSTSTGPITRRRSARPPATAASGCATPTSRNSTNGARGHPSLHTAVKIRISADSSAKNRRRELRCSVQTNCVKQPPATS